MSKNCGAETSSPDGLACSLDRRRFLQAIAGGLGVAIVGGCASSGNELQRPPTAIASGNEWRVPGGAKLLPGQALAFRFPDDSPGLVFLTTQNQWRAISAKCTHAGCTVLWQDGQELLCPCHNSRFDLNGKVLTGPATQPLPLYTAQSEGDDVVIKAK